MGNSSEQKKSEYLFPSNSVPNEEKDSHQWGMTVANAIEGRWFARESNTSQFYVNRNRYHTLRLYAKGDQDIRRYKDEFSINGDLSYLNLDWTPVPIIPKFVDIVVNGMQDRGFEPKAQSIDQTASVERKRFIDIMRGEMENKETLLQLQEVTGVEVFENPVDELPKSEEELELHLQLNYKQGVEIAIEQAIQYELKLNEFDNIKYRFDYDLTTVGIGAVKHQFIPGEGIKIEYVDPANLVYSDTDSMYYDDCIYFGEIKRTHVTDLQVQFPHLSSEEVEMLENIGSSVADNYNATPYNKDNGDPSYVDVIYFCYKTVHNEIYKHKETSLGTEKSIVKDNLFEPPKEKQGKGKDGGEAMRKTARTNEVIYEGVKIVGKDILLKWELQKNMVRPSLQSPKVIMPYTVASPKQYKGKIYSLVKRMEKYADAIQLIHLKIQQVIQKMTPSGVFIDVDGLAEIDLGNGSAYNPQAALDMYFQTGSVIGRSMTDEGEFNHGKIPVQELPGSGGQQLQPLLGAYEYNLNQIRAVTGLNEARDGSSPDPKALVGVQKLAAANSNTATRHILKSSEYLTRRLAEGIALRVADVIEYSPTKEDYITALGQYNVGILDNLGDIPAREFGIFIELGPDEEEKQMVEGNIQVAISRGELQIEDAIDVRRITNPKLALQMLKVKRAKHDERKQQMDQQNIQAQAQANGQAAQVAEQAKAQAETQKSQAKIQVVQAQSQFDLQKLEAEKEAEKELLMLKHQLQLDIISKQGQQSIVAQDIKGKQDIQKEDRKAQLGGSTPVSVDNKANTIDNQVMSGGLL